MVAPYPTPLLPRVQTVVSTNFSPPQRKQRTATDRVIAAWSVARPKSTMTTYEEHIELLEEIAQAKKEEALAKKCADRRVAAYLDQLDGTNNDDIKLDYSSDLFREFGIQYE